MALTLSLTLGSTLVLMPRFDVQKLCALLTSGRHHDDADGAASHQRALPGGRGRDLSEGPQSSLDQIWRGAACSGTGAALHDLTGIVVNQGYGMTEASPVTHVGYISPPEMYRPASIGQPLALTDCRVVD